MKLNVLICPLYWGIGHATRMVPIAEMLREKGFRVFVAAPDELLAVFDKSSVSAISMKSYSPAYPPNLNLTLALILQSPFMIIQSLADRIRIRRIINDNNIDIILCDNRFGCFNRRVYSVYITHQVNIRSSFNHKWKSQLFSLVHRLVINRYDECWIPDLPGDENFSGRLSHPPVKGIAARYTGILSRMTATGAVPLPGLDAVSFHLLILSGPEPMKSFFEKKIISLYAGRREILVIVGASSSGNSFDGNDRRGRNIQRFSYTSAPELKYLVEKSEKIICRPGYSTIMDLISLGRRALLVPTPGQSEQKYLAGHLALNYHFSAVPQAKLEFHHIDGCSCRGDYGQFINKSRILTEEAINSLAKRATLLQ